MIQLCFHCVRQFCWHATYTLIKRNTNSNLGCMNSVSLFATCRQGGLSRIYCISNQPRSIPANTCTGNSFPRDVCRHHFFHFSYYLFFVSRLANLKKASGRSPRIRTYIVFFFPSPKWPHHETKTSP